MIERITAHVQGKLDDFSVDQIKNHIVDVIVSSNANVPQKTHATLATTQLFSCSGKNTSLASIQKISNLATASITKTLDHNPIQ